MFERLRKKVLSIRSDRSKFVQVQILSVEPVDLTLPQNRDGLELLINTIKKNIIPIPVPSPDLLLSGAIYRISNIGHSVSLEVFLSDLAFDTGGSLTRFGDIAIHVNKAKSESRICFTKNEWEYALNIIRQNGQNTFSVHDSTDRLPPTQRDISKGLLSDLDNLVFLGINPAITEWLIEPLKSSLTIKNRILQKTLSQLKI